MDPFTVISGAAGVLSLGITVSQGFVAYYGSFTAFSSEIQTFVTRIKGLAAVLQLLKSRLGSVPHPPSPYIADELQLASDRLDECKATLQQLSDTLNRCRGYDAAGTLTKKGKAFAKTLYPFRRGTIVALTGMATELQANLEIALQVLLLAMTTRIEEHNSMSLSVTRSIVSNTANVPVSLRRLEATQQRIADNQEQILQLVTSFQQIQLAAIDQGAISSSTQNASVVQSDQHERGHNHPFRSPRRPGPLDGSTNQCTCKRPATWVSRAWGLLSSIRFHRFGCPMYYRREVSTVVNSRTTILSRYIGYSAHFQLWVVCERPSLSLYHKLDVRRMVDWEAPAFETIRKLSIGQDFDAALLQLQHLFEDGLASPSDTLPDGSTLLHTAVGLFQSIDAKDIAKYCQFLQHLVLEYCVPLNETARGRTVLGRVVDKVNEGLFWNAAMPNQVLQVMAQFGRLLLEHEAVSTPESPCPHRESPCPPREPLYLLQPETFGQHISRMAEFKFFMCSNSVLAVTQSISGVDDEFSLSGLQIAVLQQSEEKLQQSLNQYNENPPKDITPFISAVSWPVGLRHMMKYCPAEWYPYLMSQSIIDSNLDSLKVLLHDNRCRVLLCMVEIAAKIEYYNKAIFETLVQSLVDEKRNTYHLARQHLSTSKLRDLDLEGQPGLLDARSSSVEKEVNEALGESTSVPTTAYWEYAGEKSVYHLVRCNVQAAEILYHAGFKNVDEVEADGMTPLFHLFPWYLYKGANIAGLRSYLQMCAWLLEHGASLHTTSYHLPCLPAHVVAQHLSNAIPCLPLILGLENDLSSDHETTQRNEATAWSSLCKSHKMALQQLLSNAECRDCCVCTCSINGCHPLTVLLRHFPYPPRHTALAYPVIKMISDVLPQSLLSCLAAVVIRVCIFNALEMTHTCRDHWAKSLELGHVRLEDVAEVRGEERFLIEQVEDLVAELVPKFHEMQIPLLDFLDGYMKERIEGILAENMFSADEERAMREVGVVVDVS